MEYNRERARRDIEFAIEQAGESKYSTVIIDDSFWPYKTELTLTKCDPWRDGQGRVRTSPKYNIDWDTRNTLSGRILAMGSLDFNTIEEGAEKLARQIEETKAYLYMGDD
ncbi:MAG: hypothetical protein ACE5NN_03570 [Candidatus Bathyarchaeia archaeon]